MGREKERNESVDHDKLDYISSLVLKCLSDCFISSYHIHHIPSHPYSPTSAFGLEFGLRLITIYFASL